MKIITTTNLNKLFKENDEETIIRMRNIRSLIKDNNFEYHKVGQNFLINFDAFMEKINPKKLAHRYKIPKIRTVQSATREYNKTHTKIISYHAVENCIAKNLVSYIKTRRYYLINYEELEKILESNDIKKKIKEI